ncbi:MAG: HupE/UreJ family protein [Polyangiaceae bacterium]
MSVLSVDIGQRKLDAVLDLDVRTLLDVQAYDTNDNGELEAPELDENKTRLSDYLDKKLGFKNAGKPCSPTETTIELTEGRRVLVHRSYACPAASEVTPLGTLSVDNSIFMEDTGGHRVVGKFVLGTTPIHHVFLPESQHFEFDASTAPDLPGGRAHSAAPLSQRTGGQKPTADPPKEDVSFVGWVREGIKHILLGYDHILFVIGLVVVVRRFKELALVVTSFTLAHSITLALGATGTISVASRLVESLIAASIVFVAWDNFRRFGRKLRRNDQSSGDQSSGDQSSGDQSSETQSSGDQSSETQSTETQSPRETHAALPSAPKRHFLTFGFGLVHGFGFASVLTDLGLPTRGLLGALLGFNLGVEIGQLALVAPLYPLVRYLHKKPQHELLLVRATSVVIGALGSLWLIERAFDLSLMPF